MSSILVTGGAGYIGSKIVHDLIKQNKKVVVIDNLSTGFRQLINKKSTFYKIDFSSKLLKQIIKKNNIKTIIHCAASTNVIEANKNKKKYHLNNVLKTKKLLQNIKDQKIDNFIYSSTCAVYGNVKKRVDENTSLKPVNFYGITKLKAEKLVKKYSKVYNFKYAILRYFNVAGADNKNKIGIYKNNGQLIKNIASSLISEKKIVNIFGNKHQTKDGTCIRDFIHVSDISQIHLLALKKINISNSNLILNCGYGKDYSILNIINRFEKIYKIRFIKNFLPKRDGDIVKMTCDNKKLKKKLSFKGKFNINDIIKSSVVWEKNNG